MLRSTWGRISIGGCRCEKGQGIRNDNEEEDNALEAATSTEEDSTSIGEDDVTLAEPRALDDSLARTESADDSGDDDDSPDADDSGLEQPKATYLPTGLVFFLTMGTCGSHRTTC